MLTELVPIIGYRVRTADGCAGRLIDFYFDDQQWQSRYLVIDANLPGRRRQVLVRPAEVSQPPWLKQTVELHLTAAQLVNCPPAEADPPVTLQHRVRLTGPLPLGDGFGMPMANVITGALPAAAAMAIQEEYVPGDPHLRSVLAVSMYTIEAADGPAGRVADFLADLPTWSIKSVVVQTGGFLRPNKVILPCHNIRQVDWSRRVVAVDLVKRQVDDFQPFRP